MQTPTILFLGFVLLQRLAELVIANINTRRLLTKGAHEVGADHYPFMVGMHALWLICLIGWGYDQPVHYGWLAMFGVLQILRVWILGTLGSRWTTRIIILPQPLVRRGPFRFLRHPNYTLVVAEIIAAPMVLGLVWVAALFTVLNALMLYVRIRAENRALAPLR